MVKIENGKLIRIFEKERMQIEAWGRNSLRVRITHHAAFSGENWALLPPEAVAPEITVFSGAAGAEEEQANTAERIMGDRAELKNGKLCLSVLENGKLVFRNDRGRLLLQEYQADRHTALNIRSRELKSGGASLKWDADPTEKLYGMGQYQNGIFNLKGCFLELAQRNSQVSIPFVCSDRGYGFLWNNPAVGRASFGTNMTEWQALRTQEIDFWITAGDTPAEILANYMNATGKPPVMPQGALGFWQSKLRYRTQEELLEVAREYHRRGVPLDVIVADFFHWPVEGAWCFDPEYWPDPAAMVQELKSMGTKLMVSVWPTVSIKAPNYREMREQGLLVQSENGVAPQMIMADPTCFTDFTNPDARAYLWGKIKKNYVSHGITDFWLDEAEPEYSSYDFENYRYHTGNTAEVGNQYPALYTKTFYDGLRQEGVTPVNLVRCAWAGSQRYGALVWSGDIPSTFESLRTQVVCGLQMAMSGIPWWTTDIGGFSGGEIHDPVFRELLIRWFQYGTFCPVMRLHGDRRPHQKGWKKPGGGMLGSGAENEIWSFGEENYSIMKHHIELRQQMKPYLQKLMEQAAETGAPVMRPLFYDFPEDKAVWELKDQFMLGEKLLVAPVLEYGQRSRRVYLPAGSRWQPADSVEILPGGQWVEADAPIERIPVFIRVDI